jgi:atypical protein kinase C zeta type
MSATTPISNDALLNLHFVSWGAVGIVFQISDRIVLKHARTSANDRIKQEHRVFDILETAAPCPHIIRSFLRLPDVNFLENAAGGNLEARLRARQTRFEHDFVKVDSYESASLVSRWMTELTSAAAWLETLGLAHGDIRPSNLLLDAEDHLKLADFDCAATIGEHELEAGAPPYARLQGPESGEDKGTFGLIGPRTEQFAIGSVFYFLIRGHEPYEESQIPGHDLVALLQSKQFPATETNDKKECIVRRCWHGEFASIQLLATEVGSIQTGSLGYPVTHSDEEISKECVEWYSIWKPSVDEWVARFT